MLQKLNKELSECYGRALECRRRADDSSDPGSKQDFLDMEQRWIQLAHSYDFAECLSNFTAPSRKHKQQIEKAGTR
jgi:hypothetical protein